MCWRDRKDRRQRILRLTRLLLQSRVKRRSLGEVRIMSNTRYILLIRNQADDEAIWLERVKIGSAPSEPQLNPDSEQLLISTSCFMLCAFLQHWGCHGANVHPAGPRGYHAKILE
jgi:hypothetical protein